MENNKESEAIEKLIKGRELVVQLRALIQDSPTDVEGILIEGVISSIAQALDLLESTAMKRKNGAVCSGRGGSGKRRQGSQLSTVLSKSTGDEYSWRKYGQKVIHGSKFPRSYFRCTHKHDQGCQARKQVQQHSEADPSLRTITYIGQHSCKSPSDIVTNLTVPSNSMISLGADTSSVTREFPVPSCSLFSRNRENDEEVLSNLHEETSGYLSSACSLDTSFIDHSFDFDDGMFAFDQGNIF